MRRETSFINPSLFGRLTKPRPRARAKPKVPALIQLGLPAVYLRPPRPRSERSLPPISDDELACLTDQSLLGC